MVIQLYNFIWNLLVTLQVETYYLGALNCHATKAILPWRMTSTAKCHIALVHILHSLRSLTCHLLPWCMLSTATALACDAAGSHITLVHSIAMPPKQFYLGAWLALPNVILPSRCL